MNQRSPTRPLRKPRNTLVTSSPKALRALARMWFARGFLASGSGFHGESIPIGKYPVLDSLLEAEFDRQYNG